MSRQAKGKFCWLFCLPLTCGHQIVFFDGPKGVAAGRKSWGQEL